MKTQIQNIKNYIGELYEKCDFFAHFWDIETISQNDLNSINSNTEEYGKLLNVPIKIDKKVFSEFYSIYSPLSMTVDSYFSTKYKSIPGGRRYSNNIKSDVIALFESVYECNKLKMDYEKKHNFKYDYVVRLRPDLVIHPEKSLKQDLIEFFKIFDDNVLLFAGHKNKSYHNQIEDIFWISKSEVMDKVSSFYEYESKVDFNKNDKSYDWQSVMYDWVNGTLGVKSLRLENSVMCPYYISDLKTSTDIMGTEIYGRQY
jgi:hypothetical protein